MIEERLAYRLMDLSFRKLDSNVDNIYFYYQMVQDEVILISVFRLERGEELTIDQYDYILKKIRAHFINLGHQKIRMLNLIITKNPLQMRSLTLREDGCIHWIIDLNINRLIIYETQASNFYYLKEEIENILLGMRQEAFFDENLARNLSLGEYRTDSYANFSNDYGRNPTIQRKNSKKLSWFTLMNIIMIGLNVIAFIILYYSHLFGGTDEMIRSGALSWYYVKNKGEYYRIITSMFMHGGFEHLFNNMIVLFFIGDNLERAAGKLIYLVIYFGSGIIAAISSISYNMYKGNVGFSIGASGAIFGVVGAILYILIVNKGHLEDISTRQIVLFVIFSLYGGYTSAGIDNIAHIGGFLGGLLIAVLLYRKPKNHRKEQIKKNINSCPGGEGY